MAHSPSTPSPKPTPEVLRYRLYPAEKMVARVRARGRARRPVTAALDPKMTGKLPELDAEGAEGEARARVAVTGPGEARARVKKSASVSGATTKLVPQWQPPVYRKRERPHRGRPLFVLRTAQRRRARYTLRRGGYYSLPSVRKPRSLPRPVSWLLSLTGIFGAFWMAVLAVGLFGTWIGYEYVVKDLPSVDNIRAIPFQATRIYDRTGHLLYEMYDPNEGKRIYVPVSRMPRSLIDATIAVEDRSFEENNGVDLIGIVRAAWINFTNQGSSGGSTITQQLVRRVLLPEGDERTFTRKIREAVLAMRVTEKYSKERILEIYLNEIPYGSLSYGAPAAAETYFGKSVEDLTLAESAMLAGLPQAPSVYDLNVNFEMARQRQKIVLDLMAKEGYITEAEATAAYAVDVHPVARKPRVPEAAPHFVNYVRQVLEELYGPEVANRGGLRVITTVDLQWQAEAQRIAAQQIDNIRKQGASNAAVVAINARTGEILAMVGSVDYNNPQFGEVNVATSLRQPGSSFKPLTYATAMQLGKLNPVSILPDLPTKFPGAASNQPYIPQNYDGRFHGPVTVRSALANSYNIPAVKALEIAGIPSVLDMAHRMGITTLNDPTRYGLALTLGGGEVTLLDLTSAYATFANYGYHAPATPFLKIVDAHGKTLYELDRSNPSGVQVMEQGTAFQISSMLSDNAARTPAFGPNSPLKIDGIEAAAKTGTTNDWKDSWTMGYTRGVAVGVWVGNNDGKPMAHVAGAIGAAPIWHNLIDSVYKNPDLKKVLLKPGETNVPDKFTVPAGMVRLHICPLSGMLATDACPNAKYEWFTLTDAPKQECDWHEWVPVTLHDGGASVAGAGVPKSDTIERIFVNPPAEYKQWIGGGPPATTLTISNTIGGQGGPLPTPVLVEPPPVAVPVAIPSGANAAGRPAGVQQPEQQPAVGNLQLDFTWPLEGQVVSGIVQVSGHANADSFARYRLEYIAPGAQPVSIIESPMPPVFDMLGLWNTDGLTPGPYTLRLTLETADGAALRRDLQVRVGTAVPSAHIASIADGVPVYEGEAVNIDVAADGGGAPLAGVEIYVDGRRIASLTSPPWAAQWAPITGTHEIAAKIYTVLGESATAPPVHVTYAGVRPTPSPTPAPIVWISNLTGYNEIKAGQNAVWVDVAPNLPVNHVDIYIDGFPAGFATGPGYRVNPDWTPTPTPIPTQAPPPTLAPDAAATATIAQATAEVQSTRAARAEATRTARAVATADAKAAAATVAAKQAEATASVVLQTTTATPTSSPTPSPTATFVYHQKLLDPMLGDFVAQCIFTAGRHRVTAIAYDNANQEIGRDDAWIEVVK